MGSEAQNGSAEFDGESLLATFDGDLDDVRALAALVIASIPKYVADLREAARTGDHRGVAAMAHTIRGAVGNVGATRLAGMTRDIETVARSGAAVGEAAVAGVEAATHDLVTAIGAWADALGSRTGA